MLKAEARRDRDNLDTGPIKTVKIPFYTSIVPAGFPDPEGHTQEEFLELDKNYVRNPRASFCIQVSGDSMVGAGIKSGSLLIVDRSIQPKSGNIVLALINAELTVKRFFRDENKIFLVPDNPRYPIIRIKEEDDLIVCGVVVRVVPEGGELRILSELVNDKKPM